MSTPEEVIRENGTKVSLSNPDRSLKTQGIALRHIFKRKEVWLLTLIFVSNDRGETYNGNVMAAYFSIRSRALLSFLNSTVLAIVDVLVGRALDLNRCRRSLKARYTWLIIKNKKLSEVVFVWVYWIIGTHDSDIDPLTLTSGMFEVARPSGKPYPAQSVPEEFHPLDEYKCSCNCVLGFCSNHNLGFMTCSRCPA